MTDITVTHLDIAEDINGAARAVRSTFAAWRRRDRDRRYLAGMGYRERADLGVPIGAVEREISKPFWRS